MKNIDFTEEEKPQVFIGLDYLIETRKKPMNWDRK